MPALQPYPTRKIVLEHRRVAVTDVLTAQESKRCPLNGIQTEPASKRPKLRVALWGDGVSRLSKPVPL
jgi:hypothetical protein